MNCHLQLPKLSLGIAKIVVRICQNCQQELSKLWIGIVKIIVEDCKNCELSLGLLETVFSIVKMHIRDS